jgi:hypothetical protein
MIPVISKRAVQKKIKYLFLREKAIILLRNLFIADGFYYLGSRVWTVQE